MGHALYWEDGNIKINKTVFAGRHTGLVKEKDIWADDYNQGQYSKYFMTNVTHPVANQNTQN